MRDDALAMKAELLVEMDPGVGLRDAIADAVEHRNVSSDGGELAALKVVEVGLRQTLDRAEPHGTKIRVGLDERRYIASGVGRLLLAQELAQGRSIGEATVEAVEVVDAMLGRIGEAVLAGKGILAVTADHGNAELKVDAKTGAPLTAHTTSPVPFILAGAPGVQRLREAGKLGDIAPTILPLVGLRPPPEMTGDDLRC